MPTYSEKLDYLEKLWGTADEAGDASTAALLASITADVREREEIRAANRREIAAVVQARFAPENTALLTSGGATTI